ncbi:hypothetical protein CLABU_37140 [Clostridium acetobutylicum]|nr:hypothetical protein CLABU_37140 [Clostridium acetobutylicum]
MEILIEDPVVFLIKPIAELVVLLVHVDNSSIGQAYAVNNTGELAAAMEKIIRKIENFLNKFLI